MFYVLSFAPHLSIHPYLRLGYNQYNGMTGCTLVQPKKIVLYVMVKYGSLCELGISKILSLWRRLWNRAWYFSTGLIMYS